MGSGIAFAVARALECQVVLTDADQPALERGRGLLEGHFQGAVKRGRASQEQANQALARVEYAVGLEAVAQADVVIEAVFEDLEVKRGVFKRLDELCRPEAMLASNTSGISITAIAGAVSRPERVIGTHFFNPVPAMKLVEVIRGLATSDATLERAMALCRSLDKEVCQVNDFPGFVTTRVGMAMLHEAILCLEQGVADAENVDLAMRLAYNYPMGPLELADLIGLDVALHIFESLSEELGEQFRPSPLLRQLVAAGRLGRKTGHGFYPYGNDRA